MTKNKARATVLVAVAALLVAAPAAEAAAEGATRAAAAGEAGVRATDAPPVVRVGAAVTTVPVTVVTGVPYDGVTVDLSRAGDEAVGLGVSAEAQVGRPLVHKVAVAVEADLLAGWGAHEWEVLAWTVGSDEPDGRIVPTDVRAHSMVGLTTRRVGTTLRVDGSLRGYHSTADRYVGLPRRDVSVQSFDGASWVQVKGATTDARGDLTTFGAQVAPGTPLRLVVADAPTVWGAVSAVVPAA